MPNRRIEDARLLVVDDKETNTQLLERMLRRAGYAHVTCTTDPGRVLALCAEFHPDLILLDLHMPELDGFAVMSQLRLQIPSDDYLPILVLTADVNPEAKQRALSLGARDFLTKPFDQVEVLLRIKNLVETRFLHLELRNQNELLERKVQERTAELRESLEERRMLLSRLVTAQEEERQRIANDVHDDSVQVMVATYMSLQMLRRRLSDPELARVVEDLEQTAGLSITRLRHLLFELRPPLLDDEGLAAALRMYLDKNLGEGGPAYEVDDRLGTQPPAETRIVLYRIAQEALANVRKHARATKIHLLLDHRWDGFYVRIQDDGVGFRPEQATMAAPGHLGLVSMRERAEMARGWCRVRSLPDAGTTVEFLVPADGPSLEAWELDSLHARGGVRAGARPADAGEAR